MKREKYTLCYEGRKEEIEMISLLIILVLLGILLLAISMGAIVLIDPIICILLIIGIVKLVKKFTSKKK